LGGRTVSTSPVFIIFAKLISKLARLTNPYPSFSICVQSQSRVKCIFLSFISFKADRIRRSIVGLGLSDDAAEGTSDFFFLSLLF